MPAKDKYHDIVIHALEKDGWQIIRENVPVGDEVRLLFIDIRARRDNDESRLIEVKVFEGANSPITYLEKAIGQYMMYLGVLDYIDDETPLYLAIPVSIYNTLLSEDLVNHVIQYVKVKLLVFDPQEETIIQWIS